MSVRAWGVQQIRREQSRHQNILLACQGIIYGFLEDRPFANVVGPQLLTLTEKLGDRVFLELALRVIYDDCVVQCLD